jgi:hypothetical protein
MAVPRIVRDSLLDLGTFSLECIITGAGTNWRVLGKPMPNEKHGSVLLRFEQFVKVQLLHACSIASTVAEDGSEYSRSHEYIMHCQLADPVS